MQFFWNISQTLYSLSTCILYYISVAKIHKVYSTKQGFSFNLIFQTSFIYISNLPFFTMLWIQHQKKSPKLLPGTDVLEFNWLRGFQRRHHTPNATCHRLVPTSPLLKPAGVMFHSGLLPFRRHQTTWRGAGRIFLLSASSPCWRAAVIQTDSAVRHWQGFYVPAEMSPLCYLRALKDDRHVHSHMHSLTGSCVRLKVSARQTSFARPRGGGS